MELREIEYFISIVENNGLSGAARELFVSQSALSQFLLKLESQVGTPLFFRNHKALTLTEAGEIYYENAKKILQIKQETLLRIGKCIERYNENLSIGVTGIRTFRYASEIISQLSSLHPNCKARIIEGLALELFEQLKQGTLDFVIAPFADDPEICYTPFKANEILAILPTNHPLAYLGKDSPDEDLNRIDIHELSSSQFVLCKKGTALRKFCDLYFEKNNFKPNILAEGVYNLSVTELVEAGKAVTLNSPYYAKQIKNVCFVALNNPMYYNSGIAHCKGTTLTQTMKAFLNLSVQNSHLY